MTCKKKKDKKKDGVPSRFRKVQITYVKGTRDTTRISRKKEECEFLG